MSKTRKSTSLNGEGCDGRGRWNSVDNVRRLSKAKIFVTDEAHGRRSRGGIGAFDRPKANQEGIVERLGLNKGVFFVVFGCVKHRGSELDAVDGW